MEFIAKEKPDLTLIGDKLKRAINLLSEVMREKTRILTNTPDVFLDTNDFISVN